MQIGDYPTSRAMGHTPTAESRPAASPTPATSGQAHRRVTKLSDRVDPPGLSVSERPRLGPVIFAQRPSRGNGFVTLRAAAVQTAHLGFRSAIRDRRPWSPTPRDRVPVESRIRCIGNRLQRAAPFRRGRFASQCRRTGGSGGWKPSDGWAGDEERFRSVPPVLYEEQPSLGATGNCEVVAPFAADAAIARVVALNGAL